VLTLPEELSYKRSSEEENTSNVDILKPIKPLAASKDES
jgi:hypothetical protein